MTKSPLVSIITVVYNGEKYIEQTINSVYNQTYNNIEYIIIDGKSTDNTINIIKENEHKITDWISEEDDGLYDAMNKGVKRAKGELIGIINSDDWYELDAVETVVEHYLKHSAINLFHADRFDVYPDGSRKIYPFNKSVLKFKYLSMTYNHPSMFITKREYERHIYNTNLKVYSDFQFVLEAFLRDPSKILYINKPIVNFRLGGVSGQIPLIENLKEGFTARKNAGMNIVDSSLFVIFKLALELYKKIFK